MAWYLGRGSALLADFHPGREILSLFDERELLCSDQLVSVQTQQVSPRSQAAAELAGADLESQFAALEGSDVDDELAALTDPGPFERPDEPIAQPPYDESKPNMHYPPAVREAIMGTPDADVWNNFSVTEPPVPLD